MNRRIAVPNEGHLSLIQGEGEGEGLFRTPSEVEPLTFILSPSRRGEAAMGSNIVVTRK